MNISLFQFNYYVRQGGDDAKIFIRSNLKKIMSDEVAMDFSWQGTETKQKIQHFNLITILKSKLSVSKYNLVCLEEYFLQMRPIKNMLT